MTLMKCWQNYEKYAVGSGKQTFTASNNQRFNQRLEELTGKHVFIERYPLQI